MTIGLLVLSAVLMIFSVWIGTFAHKVRKDVSAMHGMLFAMAIAMVKGLFAGTLFGILFKGHTLFSTLMGIGSGAIAGIIIGSFFSFLAILEGVLSGVMAGMMGAMLGEMLAPVDWDRTIMILFTIGLSICLLILYEIFTYVKKRSKWIRLYQNPFIMGPVFLILCFFLYLMAPFFPEMAHNNIPHH